MVQKEMRTESKDRSEGEGSIYMPTLLQVEGPRVSNTWQPRVQRRKVQKHVIESAQHQSPVCPVSHVVAREPSRQPTVVPGKVSPTVQKIEDAIDEIRRPEGLEEEVRVTNNVKEFRQKLKEKHFTPGFTMHYYADKKRRFCDVKSVFWLLFWMMIAADCYVLIADLPH